MIHCDYEVSFFLMDLYGKVQPEMMKFWLPSFEPQVFRPLFVKENRLDLYDEKDSPEAIMGKIALMTQQPIGTIEGQFELLGYPVASEFRSIQDKEALREKWKIHPDETPILVCMAKNGVGVLDSIFDQLKAKPGDSYKYLFVCGKNGALKQKLEEKARGTQQFSIHGLLTHGEMNELMNLCPVAISKPGGSMTAEAIATGNYLLMMWTYPWEEANGAKLERMGLGQKIDENLPLSEQIENCIGNRAQPEKKWDNWKSLLMAHLEKLRNGLTIPPTHNYSE